MSPKQAAVLRDPGSESTLRNHLIAAAARLIGQRRSAVLTVREIAPEAKVADGVLYNHHFANEEALIVHAVHAHVLAMVRQTILRLLEAAGRGSVEENLRSYLIRGLELLCAVQPAAGDRRQPRRVRGRPDHRCLARHRTSVELAGGPRVVGPRDLLQCGPAAAHDLVGPLADLGITWWDERMPWDDDLERTEPILRRIDQGPPRIWPNTAGHDTAAPHPRWPGARTGFGSGQPMGQPSVGNPGDGCSQRQPPIRPKCVDEPARITAADPGSSQSRAASWNHHTCSTARSERAIRVSQGVAVPTW
jgi:AcrR family transcriptional regulator